MLHLALKDLSLKAALSSRENSFEALCDHVQVDSCVRKVKRLPAALQSPLDYV